MRCIHFFIKDKLQSVVVRVSELENELAVKHKQVQELRADLEASKLEKRKIHLTLDSTLDEKKQMTDKINHLTIIGKYCSKKNIQ